MWLYFSLNYPIIHAIRWLLTGVTVFQFELSNYTCYQVWLYFRLNYPIIHVIRWLLTGVTVFQFELSNYTCHQVAANQSVICNKYSILIRRFWNFSIKLRFGKFRDRKASLNFSKITYAWLLLFSSNLSINPKTIWLKC